MLGLGVRWGLTSAWSRAVADCRWHRSNGAFQRRGAFRRRHSNGGEPKEPEIPQTGFEKTGFLKLPGGAESPGEPGESNSNPGESNSIPKESNSNPRGSRALRGGAPGDPQEGPWGLNIFYPTSLALKQKLYGFAYGD